jgi:predicted AAA+ superfamily ATPase
MRCNRALLSLKYFKENDPGYHIIATGSLLGIRDDFSFPVGGVNMLRMYPMDIEEFVLATGNVRIADGIMKSFSSQNAYELHEKAMEIYRMYTAVGGLPEAVKSFSEGADASFQNRGTLSSPIIQ